MGGGHRVHRRGPVDPHQGVTRVFFDGTCGLCRGAVRFAARRDRSAALRFAPLGGETFQRRVPAVLQATLPDSLVVLTPAGEVLVGSTAVAHLLLRLGGGWGRVGAALGWVPLPLREAAYRLVALLRPAEGPCVWAPFPGDDRLDP